MQTDENPEPSDAERLCDQVAARLSEGPYEEALADLTEVLRLDPQSGWAYKWRGTALLDQGRVDEALADYSEAIRLQPDDANAYINRGVAHHRSRDYAAAIADYSQAIRLDPEIATAYLYRGQAHKQLGESDEAIADFTAAIRLDPHDGSTYRWRGSTFLQQREIDEALADYDEAVRLLPDDANAYRGRGVAHAHDQDYDAAIADYSQAIRLSPEDATAYLYRGQAHEWLKESEEAVADFTRAIQLDPARAEAFLYRGRIRLDEDQIEQAITDFTEAIRLDPDNRKAYRGRGEAWDQLGEHEKADADFETADRLHSHHDETMPERKSLVHPLLLNHFVPTPLDALAITERRFPGRVRADLQRAIDSLFEQMTVRHFCGVRKQYAHDGVNFTERVIRDRNDPPLAVPPHYEEIDIGEDRPLRCLNSGLWLLEEGGQRFAVFLEPEPSRYRACGVRFQVAAANDEPGTRITQRFFEHLERAVEEARCYRGKILSLEYDEGYRGTSTGIHVHKLRPVERDQVILPKKTLELLERNVIQFVRQRPRLAELGLATKKGLLFYGPPGTGKTHTIHYLAGALEGMTTLLISAEQVGFLGEYMTLARLLQPSMVVIEDADLIARERSHNQAEVLLNKLLNEMDGLKESADILFVLTTNRPEALEAALASRPGRIDQAIEFPFPDEAGREKLVRLYSRGVAVPEDVVRATVGKTENVSAAFIKELMRRATQFQLERDGSGEMTQADVENALDELLFSGGSLNRRLLGGMVASEE